MFSCHLHLLPSSFMGSFSWPWLCFSGLTSLEVFAMQYQGKEQVPINMDEVLQPQVS